MFTFVIALLVLSPVVFVPAILESRYSPEQLEQMGIDVE